MLMIAKSIAQYLIDTTTIDMALLPPGGTQVLVRPADFPATVHVVDAESDLLTIAPTMPIITVGVIDDIETRPTMGSSAEDEATLFVGIHASLEDQLDRFKRWVRDALDLAFGLTIDGGPWSGVPLRGINFKLRFSDPWWESDQPGWYTSPMPVVRQNGLVVTPDSIDYENGRVQIDGSVSGDEVRADFTCGVWSFGLRQNQRPDISEVEPPAHILHKHNLYIVVEGEWNERILGSALR